MEEKKLYFKGFSYSLSNIKYDSINNTSSEKVDVLFDDQVKILSVTEKDFSMAYVRHIHFEPKSLFDLSVEYIISFNFSNETINEYKNNFNDLQQLVEIKAIKALEMTGVISKASNLISNISMQNNNNPIITPPLFLTKK